MCISIVSFSDTEAKSEKRIFDKLRGIIYHKRVLYICVYVYIWGQRAVIIISQKFKFNVDWVPIFLNKDSEVGKNTHHREKKRISLSSFQLTNK